MNKDETVVSQQVLLFTKEIWERLRGGMVSSSGTGTSDMLVTSKFSFKMSNLVASTGI